MPLSTGTTSPALSCASGSPWGLGTEETAASLGRWAPAGCPELWNLPRIQRWGQDTTPRGSGVPEGSQMEAERMHSDGQIVTRMGTCWRGRWAGGLLPASIWDTESHTGVAIVTVSLARGLNPSQGTSQPPSLDPGEVLKAERAEDGSRVVEHRWTVGEGGGVWAWSVLGSSWRGDKCGCLAPRTGAGLRVLKSKVA